MKPSMECTLALVADAANTDASGKLNVLGIFDNVVADEFPYLHPQMFVITRLKAAPSEFGRKIRIEIMLLDPDGRALTSLTGDAAVPRPDKGGPATMQIVLGMVNTPFPRPGPYAIDVLVGGDRKGSIPLEAVLRKPASRRRKARQ